MSSLDQYAEAYEKTGPYYFDNQKMQEWYPKRIIEQHKGSSCLELGVGHGYTSINFSKAYPRHLVIEGSQEVIDKFQQRHPGYNIRFSLSYFEDFETDEQFDLIVMGFILEHVDDPDVIMERFKRFLKPGGSLFVAVPNATTLNKQIGLHAGMIDDIEALSEADYSFGHQRTYTVKSLKELALKHGYTIEHLEGIYLKPFSTKQLDSLQLPEEVYQAMFKLGVNYPELSVALLMELK